MRQVLGQAPARPPRNGSAVDAVATGMASAAATAARTHQAPSVANPAFPWFTSAAAGSRRHPGLPSPASGHQNETAPLHAAALGKGKAERPVRAPAARGADN